MAGRRAWRGQPGLFDLDDRYAALSAAGDRLERLAIVVDFELFRPELEAALARSDLIVRSVGLARATARLGLANLSPT